MSRPPGQLPALQRAKGKDGQRIGSYFLWTRDPETKKYSRINLATKDQDKAKRRRTEALGGKRDFVYDDDEPTPPPPPPAPPIPVVTPPTLALVEDTPQPIVLPPEPAPLAQGPAPAPEPAPAQTGADDWTRDAARAAGAPEQTPTATTSSEPENKDEPAPAATPPAQPVDDGKVRIKDIALMKTVFVSASRIAVQLQIALHVLVARYLFKLELDPIRDDLPKDVAGFMAAQAQPWPETDPREPGRAMWEQFGKRVCPDDLVVPDWVLAPALVALGTLPVQVAHAKPVVKVKPNVPVLSIVPAPPVAAPAAPTPERQPEPTPPAPEPKRSSHIPVMPEME